MTELDDICSEIRRMADAGGIEMRLDADAGAGVVKIISGKATALSQAKNGLASIDELALEAAEHHPYWNLLYSCAQMAGIILDRWDGDIAQEEQSELRWHAAEIQNAIDRISSPSQPQKRGAQA